MTQTDRPEREVEGLEYRLRDNQHPNTNGSPWGEIQDDQGRRVAVYSGWGGKERAQEMVDAIRTLTVERDGLDKEARDLREALESTRAELTQYRNTTEAVRVCRQHIYEIVADGGCLVCENKRLLGKVGAARRWLELGEMASAARALEPEAEE